MEIVSLSMGNARAGVHEVIHESAQPPPPAIPDENGIASLPSITPCIALKSSPTSEKDQSEWKYLYTTPRVVRCRDLSTFLVQTRHPLWIPEPETSNAIFIQHNPILNLEINARSPFLYTRGPKERLATDLLVTCSSTSR